MYTIPVTAQFIADSRAEITLTSRCNTRRKMFELSHISMHLYHTSKLQCLSYTSSPPITTQPVGPPNHILFVLHAFQHA